MSAEQFTNDAVTTLVGTIAAGDTSLTVANATAFPSVPQFRIRIDAEILLVTAVAGATWTVTRAVEAVTGIQVAAAHASGAAVTEVLTAAALTNLVGGGTVTTVSVVTANGVSGSVANPTTTPAITISLGAITPTSVAASGTVTGSNLSGTSSGTNTGDQTITLTGDVTGSGTGSFAATIGNNKVTLGKIAQINTHTLLANPTGATANVQAITLGTGLSFSGTTLVGSLAINESVTGTAGNSLLAASGGGLKQVGAYTASSATVSFGTVAAGNGTASLSDPSGAAGVFIDAASAFQASLGFNSTAAGAFVDVTNNVYLCDTTYAINCSGPCLFNGNLGFFGVAVVAQQTGGAATAGGAYTATEQGMINRMYSALRAYGLLT